MTDNNNIEAQALDNITQQNIVEHEGRYPLRDRVNSTNGEANNTSDMNPIRREQVDTNISSGESEPSDEEREEYDTGNDSAYQPTASTTHTELSLTVSEVLRPENFDADELAELVQVARNFMRNKRNKQRTSKRRNPGIQKGGSVRIRNLRQGMVVQTIGEEAPKLPLLEDFNDQSWIRLKYKYREYVAKCERNNIVPLTIDNCLADEGQDSGIRTLFRLGMLQQKPDDPDIIEEEVIWEKIRSAEDRVPQDRPVSKLLLLEKYLKETSAWDMNLKHIPVRVNAFAARIQIYLRNQGLSQVWYDFNERATELDKGDQTSVSSSQRNPIVETDTDSLGKGIVVAMINVLQPDTLRRWMHRAVKCKTRIKQNPICTLEKIQEVAELLNKAEVITAEVAEISVDEYRYAKPDSSQDSRANDPEPKLKGSVAKQSGVVKMKTYPNAKCRGCGAKGHWFLVKKNGGYVQNCDQRYTTSQYSELKANELKKIKDSEEARRQKQGTTHTANQASVNADSDQIQIALAELQKQLKEIAEIPKKVQELEKLVKVKIAKRARTYSDDSLKSITSSDESQE